MAENFKVLFCYLYIYIYIYINFNKLVELEKDKTKVGDIILKVVRSALTATGGGTYARYQDFEGFAMWEEILLLHGEHKINTVLYLFILLYFH